MADSFLPILSPLPKILAQLPMKAPFIFVLEPDDDVRPALKQNLQHWGYDVVMAIDAGDAIQYLRGGQTRFDLILLNQNNQSIDEILAIGQQIRQSTERDSQTPILVMAERYGADLEGQDIQVGGHEYVTYLEDGEQLKSILQKLCPIQED
ncbi:MAG TPA: response regulator [Trichocoleus sp.]